MPEAQLRRRERLLPAVAALGADAALITSPANVRYLSGLASSNAALLVPAASPGGSGATVLATDSRYAGTARQDCPDLDILIERYIEPALARVVADRGTRKLAFEAQEMTVERYEAFAAAVPGAELVPLGRAVEEIRMSKDEQEIALLARACEITSRAFEQIVPLIRAGVTERELAISLERAMTDLGADGLAFDTIVASGPNGAIPHHVPSARPFAAGDLITVNCGARYGGYHADMTRTVVLGEPAAWQRDIYALVSAAQAAGIDAAVPGADVQAVDAAARGLIAGAGHGEHFQHGLGHGVGLEVHEAPIMGYGRTGTLGDRVPITVEPGIYLPGQGGVRIEDTLVVRAGTGTAAPQELLTTTTRELLVLSPAIGGGAGSPARGRHTDVATTNDLKNGMTLNIDGNLWNVVDFQHVKPGKGGAFVRTRLKNIMSGKVVNRTFNAGVKVNVANVNKREMQYLYREGDDFVFMDTQDYDQPRIPRQTVGGAADYLLEEQTATVAFNDGTPLYVELPASVELTVSQTDPGVQGDRSTGGTKPATLETGAQISVPLFITTGEKIKVDTRTGDYMGRA